MDRTEERRKDYESPCTRQTQVEMEEGVCAAAGSITDDRKKGAAVTATPQEYEEVGSKTTDGGDTFTWE